MKNNESGRSMVEMLGVLAIIGVLSIGGIAGYTMAMRRYRANEVIDAAAKVGVLSLAQTTAATNTSLDIDLPSDCAVTGTAGEYTVTLTGGNCLNDLGATIETIAGDKYDNGTFNFAS